MSNLSEEEKKAIEELKNRQGYRVDFKCKRCNSGDVFIIPPEVLYGKEIDIALNLIDRLQKENEELKNADLTCVYINGFYDSESKWKDKIKAKIKELEEKQQKLNEEGAKDKFLNIFERNLREVAHIIYTKDVLEDLLKEN